MSKDPAILFYTSDFLTGTFTMTDEQTGRYIRLLCLQHQKGFLTLQDLEFICKGKDPVVFSKFEEKEPGRFINNTLAKHAEARKNYSESRRNNRSKKDLNKICYTYDVDMVNVIVIEDVNKIEYEKVNVFLTKEESEKLKTDYGEMIFLGAIKILIEYGMQKPKKFKEYTNHNLAIRKWCIDAYKEQEKREIINKTNARTPDYKSRKADVAAFGDATREILSDTSNFKFKASD